VRPATFGAVAVATVYRTEDQSFGTKPNVGAGFGIEWKRLGIDVEAHRTIGLTPRAIQCGVSGVPCVGSAREGFLEATMLSGNVSYFFGEARVRPYVTGSVGVPVAGSDSAESRSSPFLPSRMAMAEYVRLA
jgi:hypothetical protein